MLILIITSEIHFEPIFFGSIHTNPWAECAVALMAGRALALKMIEGVH